MDLQPILDSLKTKEDVNYFLENFNQINEKYRLLFIEDVKKTMQFINDSVQDDFKTAALKRVTDVQKYIQEKQYLVTVFLFQPPMYTSEHYWIRAVIHECYKDWSPLNWTMEYYKQLREIFKSYK